MLRIQLMPWYAGYSVAYIQHRPDGKIAVGEPLKVKVDVADGDPIEPLLSLRKDEVQVLMDDLWNCGIRPSEVANDVGELRATKEHLKDMQAIVFKELPVRGDR